MSEKQSASIGSQIKSFISNLFKWLRRLFASSSKSKPNTAAESHKTQIPESAPLLVLKASEQNTSQQQLPSSSLKTTAPLLTSFNSNTPVHFISYPLEEPQALSSEIDTKTTIEAESPGSKTQIPASTTIVPSNEAIQCPVQPQAVPDNKPSIEPAHTTPEKSPLPRLTINLPAEQALEPVQIVTESMKENPSLFKKFAEELLQDISKVQAVAQGFTPAQNKPLIAAMRLLNCRSTQLQETLALSFGENALKNTIVVTLRAYHRVKFMITPLVKMTPSEIASIQAQTQATLSEHAPLLESPSAKNAELKMHLQLLKDLSAYNTEEQIQAMINCKGFKEVLGTIEGLKSIAPKVSL